MATCLDPLWMRVSVAGKIHKPKALIYLLHNVFCLPKNGNQLFNLLNNFKSNAPKGAKKAIQKDQWNLLCHQCNKQTVCPKPCPKQGVTDFNDLDITTLAMLYRNIEYIIPMITQHLLQLKTQYQPFVDQACKDRNFLMHFSSKSMSQTEFDDAWNRAENCLKGMNYLDIDEFINMKTCLLDEYYKQQIECLSDVCDDLKSKKGNAADVKINEQNIEALRKRITGNELININISFDVKIPEVQLPRSVLSLDGELMDHVTSFAEVFITTLSGVKDVEIIRRECIEEQQDTNLASVRVEITIAHQSPLILKDYTNMKTEQSKRFRNEFFMKIKAYLDRKYDTVVNIFLKGWKPGSIKLIFDIENLETVDVQLQEVEEFMEKQLALLIPDCLVNIFIHHKGSNVKMEKKLFLSFSVILLEGNVEDLPTDVEIKLKEFLRSEAEKYVLKKQAISRYNGSDVGKNENPLIKCNERQRVQLEVLGEKHLDYLTSKNNIALCLMEMGHYKIASMKFNELQPVILEILGEKHPDYLRTKNNIALCFMKMGKYENALIKCNELEPVELEVLGEKHPDYLRTKNYIASCFMRIGKYENALMKFNKLEPVLLEVLGEKHHDYLTFKNNIASCLMEMGHYEKAIMMFNELEPVIFTVLGEKHPDYLRTKNNIALCLMNMGKYKDSLIKFNELQPVILEVLGEKHPDYLVYKNNIASCLMKIGKYENA